MKMVHGEITVTEESGKTRIDYLYIDVNKKGKVTWWLKSKGKFTKIGEGFMFNVPSGTKSIAIN